MLFSAIYTALVEMLGGKESAKYARKPEIVADTAYYILSQDPKSTTGNFFVDEDILQRAGITDLDQYACDPAYKDQLMPDVYIDQEIPAGIPAFSSVIRKVRTSCYIILILLMSIL